MQDRGWKILASLLAVFMTLQAFGNSPADSVKVYFRVGQRAFDPELRNNKAVMDSFVNIVSRAKAEDNIKRIVVSGYASPDGVSTANERLSLLRCENIADYLVEHTGVSRSSIETIAGGIAWDELRRLVEANPSVPKRERVLEILDHTPVWIFNRDGLITSGRKAQLMSLSRGEPYRWILTNLFPELRNAVAISVFFYSIPADQNINVSDYNKTTNSPLINNETIPNDSGNKPVLSNDPDITYDTIETNVTTYITENNATEPPITSIPESSKASEASSTSDVLNASEATHRFALKTNILYDAALVPNLGAEFYLGKNLSVYGEWMYAWWDNNPRHRYWRVYGGDLGLRWWFGRKAHSNTLTGHHLGIYGGILTFDFENGDTGYLGGKPGGTLWDRWLLNAGIEYGFSLPVAKRLNIDFSIGLGYLGGNYIKYYPFDNDYYFDKEYKMHYFGPTKVEISLVWLIGKGNTNGRKGGDR